MFVVRNQTRQTELGDRIWLAATAKQRRIGLLGRNGLDAGEGLWIRPCEAVHTFGMRFSIDLVYLDRRLRVRKTRSNVPMRRLSACLRAHSILELPAGAVGSSRTQPGDQLELVPTSAADSAG